MFLVIVFAALCVESVFAAEKELSHLDVKVQLWFESQADPQKDDMYQWQLWKGVEDAFRFSGVIEIVEDAPNKTERTSLLPKKQRFSEPSCWGCCLCFFQEKIEDSVVCKDEGIKENNTSRKRIKVYSMGLLKSVSNNLQRKLEKLHEYYWSVFPNKEKNKKEIEENLRRRKIAAAALAEAQSQLDTLSRKEALEKINRNKNPLEVTEIEMQEIESIASIVSRTNSRAQSPIVQSRRVTMV